MAAVALGFGVVGLVAGALARLVLAAMARGTRVRAPVCEVAVGVAWTLTGGLRAAGLLPSAWLPALLGLGWLAVAAGVVDVRRRLLPDALTRPALGVAPLALLPVGVEAVGRGLVGAIAATVTYGALHLARPSALGAGDVKLAAVLGTVLAGASWGALVAAAALAAVLTGLVAAAGVLAGRLSWGAAVPHGPPMLAAAWVVTVVTAVTVGGSS